MESPPAIKHKLAFNKDERMQIGAQINQIKKYTFQKSIYIYIYVN